jgi:hypothetical protein
VECFEYVSDLLDCNVNCFVLLLVWLTVENVVDSEEDEKHLGYPKPPFWREKERKNKYALC